MAITTYATTVPAQRRPSFLRRLLDAVIEARMAEAQRHVDRYLMTLDDATLAKYGIARGNRAPSTHQPTAY